MPFLKGLLLTTYHIFNRNTTTQHKAESTNTKATSDAVSTQGQTQNRVKKATKTKMWQHYDLCMLG